MGRKPKKIETPFSLLLDKYGLTDTELNELTGIAYKTIQYCRKHPESMKLHYLSKFAESIGMELRHLIYVAMGYTEDEALTLGMSDKEEILFKISSIDRRVCDMHDYIIELKKKQLQKNTHGVVPQKPDNHENKTSNNIEKEKPTETK